MADVRALRGVRYDPRQHANLGRLIAPPYDTAELDQLGAQPGRSTFNIAELENVDLAAGVDSHALAAARYRDWRDKGLLVQDDEPSIYVHDHTFVDSDQVHRRRRGLLARVRLEEWNKRIVLPHERTIPGPRNERLARLRAVHANLSPLYLLYNDAEGTLRDALAALATASPVASGIDHLGGEHRLIRITDGDVLAAVSRFFAGERLFVADGHHRYEAALAYRDEQRARFDGRESPTDFVLAMLADIHDPGVMVRPTHRLVRNLPAFAPGEFRRRLEVLFLVETPEATVEPGPWICDLLIAGEAAPWRVSARPGSPHWRSLPDDHSPAWRELSVAVADSVILDAMLGVGPDQMPDHVSFTHDERVARQAVASGEAQVAILLSPPSLPALARVAEAGETLPPKSSYFDPKPPAGLVINDLTTV